MLTTKDTGSPVKCFPRKGDEGHGHETLAFISKVHNAECADLELRDEEGNTTATFGSMFVAGSRDTVLGQPGTFVLVG